MTDTAPVLALFDAAMRAEPPPEAGVTRTWSADVLRSSGPTTWIDWWSFDRAEAPRSVAREAALCRAGARALEWKVYGHDRPPGLEDVLAGAGFVPEEAETFMVLDLQGPAPPSAPAQAVDIRRVTDAAGLRDLLAVNALAFGEARPWQEAAFAGRLDDATLGLFVAYADGAAVASGRLELPAGRPFAGLWGGGTAPDFRGRGLYRALVAARAGVARLAGYRFLTVDAAPTSRPILERLGFLALTTVHGWTLTPAASEPVLF